MTVHRLLARLSGSLKITCVSLQIADWIKTSFDHLRNPMAHYGRLCRSFGVVLGGCL